MSSGLFQTGVSSMSRLTAFLFLGLVLYEPAPLPLPAATRSCVLAIPPSQVVKTARLEPLYCYLDRDGVCHPYTPGWIVVSEAIACD